MLNPTPQENLRHKNIPDALNLLFSDEEVNLNCTIPDYAPFETVLDSGATESVVSKQDAPDYPIQESPGSKRGQCYKSASGQSMPNQGQKLLRVATDEGQEFGMTYQVTDVAKGLTSVGGICDAGDGQNFVVFTSAGGYIASPQNWTTTKFTRKNGAYILRTWLRKPSTGFGRQG